MIWVQSLGGLWHVAREDQTVKAGLSAWTLCPWGVAQVVAVSQDRPSDEEALCKVCRRKVERVAG